MAEADDEPKSSVTSPKFRGTPKEKKGKWHVFVSKVNSCLAVKNCSEATTKAGFELSPDTAAEASSDEEKRSVKANNVAVSMVQQALDELDQSHIIKLAIQ